MYLLFSWYILTVQTLMETFHFNNCYFVVAFIFIYSNANCLFKIISLSSGHLSAIMYWYFNCFHYIQLFNYNHLIVFPVGTFMKRMLTCSLPNVLCVKNASKMSSKWRISPIIHFHPLWNPSRLVQTKNAPNNISSRAKKLQIEVTIK